jgi:hypothetical protein
MMAVVFSSVMMVTIYQTTEETTCNFIAVKIVIFKPLYYYFCL